MDESGDLGFNFNNKKTSNFFIITFVFSQNNRILEKCVKKTHRILRERYRKVPSVLHACKEDKYTKLYLLKQISNREVKIMSIILNKIKVYVKLQDEKNVLYNYVTNILLDRVINKKYILCNCEKVYLISSKRETNKFLNSNFKKYLESNNKEINLSVYIKTPFEDKNLQAVDFISWSIFRKYEFRDVEYYNIFKDKICEENLLFP